MDDRNSLDPLPEDGLDWSALVESIQDRLYLSQLDIGRRCGVARQTVSAWTKHRRNPGLKARRALLGLAAEAGAVPELAVPAGPVPNERGRLREAHELGMLVGELPAWALQEVLDFARFLLARERMRPLPRPDGAANSGLCPT